MGLRSRRPDFLTSFISGNCRQRPALWQTRQNAVAQSVEVYRARARKPPALLTSLSETSLSPLHRVARHLGRNPARTTYAATCCRGHRTRNRGLSPPAASTVEAAAKYQDNQNDYDQKGRRVHVASVTERRRSPHCGDSRGHILHRYYPRAENDCICHRVNQHGLRLPDERGA